METLSLNGDWTFFQAGDETPLSGLVPGCVHLDLLGNLKLEDPFYRDNEASMLWVGETDWTYQRTFKVDADLLAHERLVLRCFGLDTIATIRLNDTELAKTENMFRTYEFDVKQHLHEGENSIEIAFAAPLPYQRKMEEEKGVMAGWVEPMRISTGAWMRKEPCNFGWDWGPTLPTVGIWRDIEIVGFDTARLADVLILQNHDNGAVDLTVKLEAERLNDTPLTALIQVEFQNKIVAEAEITFENDFAESTIVIPKPQLWWINGMGEQPLYDVKVTLNANDVELDDIEKRIGLRTLTLERHADEWGESFYFACNGVPFFAKGANWIPASPYPSSPYEDEYQYLVQAAVDANMNMLRVWGGGIYEVNDFYDFCDEAGIAIWQDFMFACGTYPSFDADFMANVKAEAEDNVRRLRHHACIALWCGNNEIEQGMGNAHDAWHEVVSWEDYSKLFDTLLPDVVKALDPQTDYWPGSPHSPCGDRLDWENQTCGDTHLWYVWHGKQPFEWYRTRQDRFCSEFGFQSFPPPATIAEYTLPEDRNITSYVMEHYQRSAIGNSTIIHYMLDWFQLPNAFDMLAWLSQILQGLAMKYAIEHWRRNMPRTMGTLYWQLNDMWPAPTWSSLDWHGNWKALHHMARRFYAPMLISGLEDADANTIEIHVTSDLQTDQAAIVRWEVTDARGAVLEAGEKAETISGATNTRIETLDVSEHVTEKTARDVLVWLSLEVEGEIVSDNLVLLERPKHLNIAQPTIDVAVKGNGYDYTITLQSDTPALYVWLDLPEAHQHFSDNFFHLPANTPKTVTVHVEVRTELDKIRNMLIVKSLVDTYA